MIWEMTVFLVLCTFMCMICLVLDIIFSQTQGDQSKSWVLDGYLSKSWLLEGYL